MPLLGNTLVSSFKARPTRQEFSGDGSTTTFTLNQTVRAEDIVVSVDGVVQEPTGAYTVPDGTTLTFLLRHQAIQVITSLSCTWV